MAHQWLKWPRPSAGQWNTQPRLVAELHAQLTGSAKLELVRSVFRLHPEVRSATLFGSRAKGTHTHRSAPRRSRPSWRSCRCRFGLTCNPWFTFSTARCWSTSGGWGFSSIRRHDSKFRDAELRQ
jgi:hypothetical protein